MCLLYLMAIAVIHLPRMRLPNGELAHTWEWMLISQVIWFLKGRKGQFLLTLETNRSLSTFCLSSQLEKEGIQVKQSSGDADYDIVMLACSLGETRHVVVIGGDTNLLTLLHPFKPAKHNSIYLQTSSELINISILQSSLDPGLSESLLFIHALSDCDSTSRPYGIGKTSLLEKYRDLQEAARLYDARQKSGRN